MANLKASLHLVGAPFDAKNIHRPVFDALLEARRQFGGGRAALEDHERRVLSYDDLIRASFAVGHRIARQTTADERVGVLLPASVGGAIAFFAAQAVGRVPVMLNFSAGSRNVTGAARLASVRRIYTSRRFLELARLQPLMAALQRDFQLVYLEDLRQAFTPFEKARATFAAVCPTIFRQRRVASDPAVILFTSGATGDPKGVVLTHANIVGNAEQIAQHIAPHRDWVIFNPLPLFHAFGLVGLLLPLLRGMKAVLYPSPVQAEPIVKLIRNTKADILLGVDSFVSQYARVAAPGDLDSLRFVVCGAERVREETHKLFTAPVLEGYGATECSPVVAVNQPDRNRPGTVGPLLPGIEAYIDPVGGIARGGRLRVRGPNVMAGYLTPEGLSRPTEGWYDTGDVCDVTDDGALVVLGRLKRFAKIGGEMVSLAGVEQMVSTVWSKNRHAVVAVPDEQRGERLILITDHPSPNEAELQEGMKRAGSARLWIPQRIVGNTEIPLLASGKTDYGALHRLAQQEQAVV